MINVLIDGQNMTATHHFYLTIDFSLISHRKFSSFYSKFLIQQHRANKIRYWNTFRLFAQAWKEQHSCEEISIQAKVSVWKGDLFLTYSHIQTQFYQPWIFSWERKQNQRLHWMNCYESCLVKYIELELFKCLLNQNFSFNQKQVI